MKMSFSNKAVLVTGASSGIGAATAILFAQHGANVAMVGRNETKLKNVAEKVKKAAKKCSQKTLVIKADVADDEEVKRIIKETIKKFGKLDVLVNNAGLSRQGSILDGNILKAYDEIFSINVRAVINLTTAAAPFLLKTKGNIINISSVASVVVPKISLFTAYHVSKAALDMFTRVAALELSASGVRVNSVNPGPVKTDFLENAGIKIGNPKDFENATALNRVSDPEEIGDIILFLASEKAKGVTGSIYVSDNGYTIKQ